MPYSPRSYQGAKRQLIYGVVLLAIGIAITVGTYTWASQGGGTYIVSFGPIIFGLIRIVTAVPVLIRGRGQVQGPSGWVPPAFPSRPGMGGWAGQPGMSGQPGMGQGQSAPGQPGMSQVSMGQPGVGTPWSPSPVTPSGASGPPEPGWYHDPSGANGARWWDGSTWTDETRTHQ
jgi:hypothetical protein